MHPGVVAAEYSDSPWGGGEIGRRVRIVKSYYIVYNAGSNPAPSAYLIVKVVSYFEIIGSNPVSAAVGRIAKWQTQFT